MHIIIPLRFTNAVMVWFPFLLSFSVLFRFYVLQYRLFLRPCQPKTGKKHPPARFFGRFAKLCTAQRHPLAYFLQT